MLHLTLLKIRFVTLTKTLLNALLEALIEIMIALFGALFILFHVIEKKKIPYYLVLKLLFHPKIIN